MGAGSRELDRASEYILDTITQFNTNRYFKANGIEEIFLLLLAIKSVST